MKPIANWRFEEIRISETVAKPNRQSAIGNRQYTEEMSHDYIR